MDVIYALLIKSLLALSALIQKYTGLQHQIILRHTSQENGSS